MPLLLRRGRGGRGVGGGEAAGGGGGGRGAEGRGVGREDYPHVGDVGHAVEGGLGQLQLLARGNGLEVLQL